MIYMYIFLSGSQSLAIPHLIDCLIIIFNFILSFTVEIIETICERRKQFTEMWTKENYNEAFWLHWIFPPSYTQGETEE